MVINITMVILSHLIAARRTLAAIVLLGFIIIESKRLHIKHWWVAVVGTCTVGVSLGLPLFLLLREIHLEQQQRL